MAQDVGGTVLNDSTDTNIVTESAVDSTQNDSIAKDTLNYSSTLEHEVDYNAEDSMIIDLGEDKIYLYGKAVAEYGDIKLEADFIEISLGKNELFATGLPDSTGEMSGYPVFTQGGKSFDSEEMRYNFKTQRGLSKTVRTQEADGYLHGEVVKKDTGKVIYIKDGKYTTCDYRDPHFHIHAKKLKVITQDKIITGPAYLTVADIPTPLVVPFGFFPNTEERANGILIPTPGRAQSRGLSLENGGYYFGYKDVIDFALRADLYSRGSWNGSIKSNYAQRYKFRGSIEYEAIKVKSGDEAFGNEVDLPLKHKIRWNHRQDPKARPNSNFNASVDFGSTDADQLNLNEDRSVQLRGNSNSSITFDKNFANTPFSMRVAAQSDQNARTGLVNVKLPTVSMNMTRIYPFKSKEFKSKEMPWEQIGMSATLQAQNSVSSTFEDLLSDSTLNAMKNGAELRVPINASYKVLKYLSLNPSITNRLVGVRQTTMKQYNPETGEIETELIDDLNAFWSGSASIGLRTVFYGMYSYKSEVVKAMRHQVTPNVSLSYTPDYGDPAWGYYRTVVDSTGKEIQYSIFDNSIYGAPGTNGNGVVNFGINNAFELKVLDRQDSTGADKKLRLIDNFSFRSSYNLAKDSNNFDPLSITLSTSVVPGFQLGGSASLDPYAWHPETGDQLANFQFAEDGRLGNWKSASANLTYSIRPKSSKKETEKKRDAMLKQGLYYDDFIDYSIPWDARVKYNIRYSNNGVKETVQQNIDLSGNMAVTRNWRVGLSTSYDLRDMSLGNTNFSIYRDLHCWEMTFTMTPFGQYQRYTFSINVKAGGPLESLKIPRNKTYTLPER